VAGKGQEIDAICLNVDRITAGRLRGIEQKGHLPYRIFDRSHILDGPGDIRGMVYHHQGGLLPDKPRQRVDVQEALFVAGGYGEDDEGCFFQMF